MICWSNLSLSICGHSDIRLQIKLTHSLSCSKHNIKVIRALAYLANLSLLRLRLLQVNHLNLSPSWPPKKVSVTDMKYNARQKPYRGVVYQSPSLASSRTHPSPYLNPIPKIPPSRAPHPGGTQRSLNQPLYVNSDTTGLSATDRTTPVLTESSSDQIVPSEISSRYEPQRQPRVWSLKNGRVTISVQTWLISSLMPNCTLLTLNPVNLTDMCVFL
jgi:hypothetical protein